MSRRTNLLLFSLGSAIGFFADQVSKFAVFHLLDPDRSLWIIPAVLSFTRRVNPGAAFSILSDSTSVLIWCSVVAEVLLVIFLLARARLARYVVWAFTLISSGTLGNLCDRLAFGHVRDFIDLRIIRWPVFNLADVFITAGVAIIVLESFLAKPSPTKGKEKSGVAEGD